MIHTLRNDLYLAQQLLVFTAGSKFELVGQDPIFDDQFRWRHLESGLCVICPKLAFE